GGGDRIGNRAVGGDQNHRQGRPLAAQVLQQVDAVHAVHEQVGDHAVDDLLAQGLEGGSGILGRGNFMPGALDAQCQQTAQIRVVIDQQDMAVALHRPGPGSMSVMLCSLRVASANCSSSASLCLRSLANIWCALLVSLLSRANWRRYAAAVGAQSALSCVSALSA